MVLILVLGRLINIDFEASEKEDTQIIVGETTYSKKPVVQEVNVLGEPFVEKSWGCSS